MTFVRIEAHTFKIVSSLALPKRLREGFGDSAPLPVDVFNDCDVELLPSLCGNVFDFSQKRERLSLLSLLLLLLLESGYKHKTSRKKRKKKWTNIRMRVKLFRIIK